MASSWVSRRLLAAAFVETFELFAILVCLVLSSASPSFIIIFFFFASASLFFLAASSLFFLFIMSHFETFRYMTYRNSNA